METSTPNATGYNRFSSLSTVTPPSYFTITPPGSEERHEYSDRTFEEPDLSSATDMVSEFYRHGFPILSEHVLSFLDLVDYANACLVCKSWRDIMHSLPTIKKKLFEYRALRRALGQENRLSCSRTFTPASNASTPRIVLSNLRQHPSLLDSDPKPAKEKESPFPNGILYSHRPCLVCSSPARIYSPNYVKCLKCQYKFCNECNQDSHVPKPCTPLSSPKRPAEYGSEVVSISKSKRSRRRL